MSTDDPLYLTLKKFPNPAAAHPGSSEKANRLQSTLPGPARAYHRYSLGELLGGGVVKNCQGGDRWCAMRQEAMSTDCERDGGGRGRGATKNISKKPYGSHGNREPEILPLEPTVLRRNIDSGRGGEGRGMRAEKKIDQYHCAVYGSHGHRNPVIRPVEPTVILRHIYCGPNQNPLTASLYILF
ncbi:hypothetical protein BDK51DRAFT_32347 [Blyttiomyces helicus]|uniref:Uncharacterized protein n=1 Tax=Blyttiomyces helicus TaxID=388810 RepID=A0A4P9W044_9FUNG|nr:hypothetical protein BDK51DRAFT_32347 [Blyttiomyces helicus]|eukprot:RKO85491.1 hypothetical protein BDK51DRAFT_32347 [Blyttiomyces helicus]